MEKQKKGIGMVFGVNGVQIVHGNWQLVENWVIYNPHKAYGETFPEEMIQPQLAYYRGFYGKDRVTITEIA